MIQRQTLLCATALFLTLFAFIGCASQDDQRGPRQPAHFSDPSYDYVAPGDVPTQKWHPPRQ